jgi:hypothetical protein
MTNGAQVRVLERGDPNMEVAGGVTFGVLPWHCLGHIVRLI